MSLQLAGSDCTTFKFYTLMVASEVADWIVGSIRVR